MTGTPEKKEMLQIGESPFIWKSNASTPAVGSIVKSAAYPPVYPSPKIQVGAAR